MRKGKILLLALFVIAGLAVKFLTNVKTDNQTKEITHTVKQENILKLTEAEKKVFAEKLKTFKKIVYKLEQADLPAFKNQTKTAFNALADFINELPPISSVMLEDIIEKTVKIKQGAEKMNLLENEGKIVNEIKKGFEASEEALEKITDNLNCTDDARGKQFCQQVKEKLDNIETIIDNIDMQNYKQKTNELFLNFYELFAYMNEQINNSDVLTHESDEKLTQSPTVEQLIHGQSAEKQKLDECECKDEN
ncbi:MAG: hypothetical protein KAQ92_01135, partial [Candidatus Aenigmarchaeota archaeon]|nr:hypothetical protein [Candidatus Aenigmarchaeota archaeon]